MRELLSALPLPGGAKRLDGRKQMRAARISSMVDERLTGYTVMIVREVRFCGKTNSIHAMRMPHTPRIVSSAGASEIPKPRRNSARQRGCRPVLIGLHQGGVVCCPVLLVLFTDTHRGLGHFFSSPGLMPKLSRNAR